MKNISTSFFLVTLLTFFTSSVFGLAQTTRSTPELTDRKKVQVLCCKVAGGLLVDGDPYDCDAPDDDASYDLWSKCLIIGFEIFPDTMSKPLTRSE